MTRTADNLQRQRRKDKTDNSWKSRVSPNSHKDVEKRYGLQKIVLGISIGREQPKPADLKLPFSCNEKMTYSSNLLSLEARLLGCYAKDLRTRMTNEFLMEL